MFGEMRYVKKKHGHRIHPSQQPRDSLSQPRRAALGIDKETDILDHIYELPTPDEQDAAFDKIRAIERRAMASQKPQPGLVQLMDYLDDRGVPKGICTRNFECVLYPLPIPPNPDPHHLLMFFFVVVAVQHARKPPAHALPGRPPLPPDRDAGLPAAEARPGGDSAHRGGMGVGG